MGTVTGVQHNDEQMRAATYNSQYKQQQEEQQLAAALATTLVTAVAKDRVSATSQIQCHILLHNSSPYIAANKR
jgi:hypothetical protein